MTISIGDNTKKINDFFIKNNFIKSIFSNIFIVSIIIVIFNIILFYYNLTYEEEINLIKIMIWSLIGTNLFILMHNKTIKLYYIAKGKNEKDEEFKSMMENNVNSLLEKEGRNEINGGFIESDIIKFLDR